ncbi:DoxX family protein [Kytococcus sp. Marseille-QA3725]
MDPIRMIARPMLGGLFVATGINHIKDSEHGAEVAEEFNRTVLEPVGVPVDGSQLMKLHGYVSVIAGAGLSLGVAPRACALALAADVTAVNLTAHRFWEKDGEERQGDQIQFLKNLAIAGGLLVAAADTAGKPGLSWRAQHLADLATERTEHATTVAGLKKDLMAVRAENKALQAKANLTGSAGKAAGKAAGVSSLLGTQAKLGGKSAKMSGKLGGKTAKLGGKSAKNVFVAKKRKDSMLDRVSDAVDDAVKSAKKTVNA